jgi:hypothetical protein
MQELTTFEVEEVAGGFPLGAILSAAALFITVYDAVSDMSEGWNSVDKYSCRAR